MFLLYAFIFVISCVLIYFAAEWLIEGLMNVARFLAWKEFLVAFLIMAFAASLPNFFIGISSAFHKIPQLSLGDIIGGNVVDLTLATALAVLFAKGREILADSKIVQVTSFFVVIAAISPLILITDNEISRADGMILIILFFFYIGWVFSEKQRFLKIYNGEELSILKNFKKFLNSVGKIILGVIFLLLSAEGIVQSSQFFAESLNLPLILIGVLIIGLGNAIPETYFAIASARKGETWLILGNLMGSVVVLATLVLGIVALICPIKILDLSPFLLARAFLVASALFFFFFVRTEKKITQKEAIFLLFLYFIFLISEILTK